MNFVNIYWGNGMLPNGTKILPFPMLTSVYLSNTPRKFLSLINGVILSIWLLIWYFKRVIKPKFLECPFCWCSPNHYGPVAFWTDQCSCNPLVRMDQCSFQRVLYTVWIELTALLACSEHWGPCNPYKLFGVYGEEVKHYRKTSSISRTKFQNLNVSCILLQLSSLNALKPGVKLRMKM